MTHKIKIEVSDEMHEILKDVADKRGSTIDALVADFIKYMLRYC